MTMVADEIREGSFELKLFTPADGFGNKFDVWLEAKGSLERGVHLASDEDEAAAWKKARKVLMELIDIMHTQLNLLAIEKRKDSSA